MRISHTLKNIVLFIYKKIYNVVYKMVSFFKKTDKHKAVFVLSRSTTLEGNLKYVHDELINQHPHINIQLVQTKNKMNLKLFRDILFLADTSYLIIEDYYLPIYLIHPKKQLKVIQLWHAAGAFKKFGYSTINTKFGPSASYLKHVPIHSNYTHVYVSSSRVKSYYAEAFNMNDDRIFPYGPPRIDLFNDEKAMSTIKKNILDECAAIEVTEKTIILVAPTYRAQGSYSESTVNFIDILVDVARKVDDRIHIIFKEHPYFDQQELLQLEEYPNITHSSNYSINEWMLIADALVTDYSSSVFDFSLLKKPIAHFVPDKYEYEKNRGLYEDIKQVSDGNIIKDANQLINWMNWRQKGEYYDTSRMIQYNFDYTKDNSKRIVAHFSKN